MRKKCILQILTGEPGAESSFTALLCITNCFNCELAPYDVYLMIMQQTRILVTGKEWLGKSHTVNHGQAIHSINGLLLML